MTSKKSHCEVVVSEAVSKTLVQGQDCFASLATAKNAAGLLRFARSDAQKESLRARLFFSEAVSGIPHRFAAFRMTDEEKFAGANREILTVTAEKDPSW
jgi:hypothetical protein